MFAKRKTKTVSLPPKKRKHGAIEEISFDFGAREDFLTGFHKRKLQRIKHAQEQAAKKEREERIANRKAIRDERKVEAAEHVKQVNALLGLQENPSGAVGEGEEDDEDEEEWSGIQEATPIDHEDEYEDEDEDKFTTVTVEAVSVTKDGIHKLKNEEDEDGADSDSVPNAGAGEESDQKVAKPQVKRDANGKRIWTKENPKKGQVKPKKKKKFRYESKAERKVTRMKERSGNRRQAEERKNK